MSVHKEIRKADPNPRDFELSTCLTPKADNKHWSRIESY